MEILTYGDRDYRFSRGRFVENANVNRKKVILRCDLNVPVKNNVIKDSSRIDESLETINYLISEQAKIIVCSHLGRPRGEYESSLSLITVKEYLEKKINKEIKFVPSIIGSETKKIIDEMQFGEVCLLENLRFHIGEENCDFEFASKLAELADVYVNDAFGTCHREHSSIVLVPKMLPAFYGYLIRKEVNKIRDFVKNIQKPFVVILGGAKVSDKIGAIRNLLGKAQTIIIGGGMSYTFINALGYPIGDSICDKDKIELAKEIMTIAVEKETKLLFPSDVRIGRKFNPKTENKVVDINEIPEHWQGLDIGIKAIKHFSKEIEEAKYIYWNGPVGVSEWKAFENGTYAIAQAVARSSAESIIGGGDSGEAVRRMNLESEISHISTGGGSSLMFVEGKELPGLKIFS